MPSNGQIWRLTCLRRWLPLWRPQEGSRVPRRGLSPECLGLIDSGRLASGPQPSVTFSPHGTLLPTQPPSQEVTRKSHMLGGALSSGLRLRSPSRHAPHTLGGGGGRLFPLVEPENQWAVVLQMVGLWVTAARVEVTVGSRPQGARPQPPRQLGIGFNKCSTRSQVLGPSTQEGSRTRPWSRPQTTPRVFTRGKRRPPERP